MPNHAHELTFSTSRCLALLEPDPIKEIFLSVVNEARQNLQFEVWAYVVMPNHVHLLLFPKLEEYDVDVWRRVIKQKSAHKAVSWIRSSMPEVLSEIQFVEGGRLRTRFWQDGQGYDRNLTSPEATAASIKYIHMNPVKKGLCERPSEYRWSSAMEYETGQMGFLSIDPMPL